MPSAVMDEVDARVAALLDAGGAPGGILVVTDRGGPVHQRAFGVADLATGERMVPERPMRIGSIAKGLTAIAVLRFAERGLLSVEDPVVKHLPWIVIGGSDASSVTLHHLLTHTAGLPTGTLLGPGGFGDVYALRRVRADAPGRRFHYSNLGYSVLGVVLEEITGQPLARVLEEEVLGPLGMSRSSARTTVEHRDALPTGYGPADPRVPWLPGMALAPAAFMEWDSGGGCVVAPATDMAAYLRLLLNDGQPLLTQQSFRVMTTRPHGLEEESHAACGVFVDDAGQRTRYLHTGGNPGFGSAMAVDPEAGLGVLVLVNALAPPPFPPEDAAAAALELLVADRANESWPVMPPPPTAPDLHGYQGLYTGPFGQLRVSAPVDGLEIVEPERTRRAVPLDDDTFVVLAPHTSEHLVVFERDAGGRLCSVAEGPRWWDREGVGERTLVSTDEIVATVEGRYHRQRDFGTEYLVYLRRDVLYLSFAAAEARLEPEDDGGYRVVDGDNDFLPTRVRFGEAVGGRAPWMTADGLEFLRFFDPR